MHSSSNAAAHAREDGFLSSMARKAGPWRFTSSIRATYAWTKVEIMTSIVRVLWTYLHEVYACKVAFIKISMELSYGSFIEVCKVRRKSDEVQRRRKTEKKANTISKAVMMN